MSDKKTTTGALELVVLRNAFYRDNYKRALLALLLIIVINAGLLFSIAYKVMNPPRPQYFATTSDGRLINWHPLSDPVVSDNYVVQWTANALRKAFSLDYLHWRTQLQQASNYFTDYGWKYFVANLKKSNNLKTLTSLKMVSTVQITGAPQILEKEVIDGVYAWKVQVPIVVTYSNATRTIPQPMKVTLIVMRVPVKQDPDRIAINNFLPVPEKTATQQLADGGL